jgi:hypothetical protein
MHSTMIDCPLVNVARWLGVATLLLVFATWPLWTPQEHFPRIPLVPLSFPSVIDWLGLGLLLCGAAGLLVSASDARWRRLSAGLLLVGYLLAFITDQHRLQPWAWQGAIYSALICCGEERQAVRGARWLLISIYAYSALSKIDGLFLEGIAEQCAEWFGRPLPRWTTAAQRFSIARLGVAWLLPLGELTAAGLLAWPRARVWGVTLAALMHVTLLVWLGPWGLGHSAGVIGWNLVSLALLPMLFRESVSQWLSASVDVGWSVRTRLVQTGLLFVLVWPVTEPWGGCDPWLGWAVYVPRFTKLEIETPAEIRDSIKPPRWQDPTAERIAVAQWSLQEVGAPPYPGERFSVGVTLAFVETMRLERVTVRAWRRRSRWSDWEPDPRYVNSNDPWAAVGARVELTPDELRQRALGFWFNAHPGIAWLR